MCVLLDFFLLGHSSSQSPEVLFALKVARCVSPPLHNYAHFFKLWNTADRLQRTLMEVRFIACMLSSELVQPTVATLHGIAFRSFLRAYFDLPVSFVATTLAMSPSAVKSTAKASGCAVVNDAIVLRQQRTK